MKILNSIIWGINWFGLIISFILGYYFKKYDSKIFNYIRSWIFYFKYIRKSKSQYNDFFECNFKDSDFKGVDSDERNNN